MRNKVSILDFNFKKVGSGVYLVRYTSPNTGAYWGRRIENMSIIDITKNSDNPMRKDLEKLRRLIKTGKY
jgi:hypothetical protein